MTPGDSKDGELDRDLASLDPDLRRRLERAGFDGARLNTLAATLLEGASADARRDGRNRVREVKAPSSEEILVAPARGTPEAEHLFSLGEAAIRRGELAFCVMAGGMATRMGGVVKALVEAVPGKTFLDLRLAENKTVSERVGRSVPLWLMTSEATEGGTATALEKANAPAHVKTFTQDLGLRLTPGGRLFVGEDGKPSVYATGHGDLVDALRRSGLLRTFRQAGGRYVWIANLDNLGASIDPMILGAFISSAAEVMVEVCDKAAGDKGGIPVHVLETDRQPARLQVLEEFRLPKDFDASTVRVFNTNTFLVRADALESIDVPWNWFEVEKKVDGRVAIQFERLLQELTGALSATYIRVPREGAASRFLPVKDHDELARRQAEIANVARDRGMLEKAKGAGS
jgi:UTP--glucose-1-phosphate uridylyltransferase